MTKNEAQNRAELIDKLLIKSGWNVKDPTQVIEEPQPGVPNQGPLDLSHIPLIQDSCTVALMKCPITAASVGANNLSPLPLVFNPNALMQQKQTK